MQKQHLVALLLASILLFAGCIDPAEQTVLANAEEVSDDDLIQQTSTPLNETIPAVAEAIEQDESDRTEQTDALGETGIVSANDSYYEVNRTVVAELNATQVTYRVTIIENGTADYDFEELSPEDREMVATASILADESDDGTIEGALYENETELPESVLASGNTTVEYNGTIYHVEPFATTMSTQEVYVYTITRVASSDAEYVNYIDERYTIPLDDASESARMFFENVSKGDGQFRGVGGEGHVALRDQLADDKTIESNTWLVRYQGDRYRLYLTVEGYR